MTVYMSWYFSSLVEIYQHAYSRVHGGTYHKTGPTLCSGNPICTRHGYLIWSNYNNVCVFLSPLADKKTWKDYRWIGSIVTSALQKEGGSLPFQAVATSAVKNALNLVRENQLGVLCMINQFVSEILTAVVWQYFSHITSCDRFRLRFLWLFLFPQSSAAYVGPAAAIWPSLMRLVSLTCSGQVIVLMPLT